MNYLKSLILILFTFVCFSAHAEDETITFTPVVAHSSEPVIGNDNPDEMNYGNITISADMANFNYNSSKPYYRLFSYAQLTISSESRIKKVVLYKHSSSPKEFSLDGKKNKGIKGSLTTKDSNNRVEWKCGSDNVNTISFYCTFGVTVYISSIEVTVEKKTGEQITLSSLGYGTMYYGTKALVVPEGIEAMTYTLNGNKLVQSMVYRQGETIPQATGVVLKGNQGSYTFTYSEGAGTAPSGNLLRGTDTQEDTTGDGLFYKLAQDPDNAQNVGFFWGADNGGAFTNGAHKAYLCVPASAGVRAFILLNEEATAINKLSTDIQTHETYYTLGGQQLSEKPAKGAVIVSKGKKFVVR